MIVKCENCQTRFKIPDDKVSEKGVKVRCTKCAHTFRVQRGPDGNALIVPAAPSAAPPVPAQAVQANPFAQFVPPAGGDMFSKETRVAPAPVRPEVTVRAPPPSAATLRAASSPEVTVRAPPPTQSQAMAMAFGLDDSGARTDPAAVYGARSPQITAPAPRAPAKEDAHAALTDPAAALSGPPPPVVSPAARGGGELFGDTLASSGPESGGFPAAGPDRSLFDIPPPPPEPAAPAPELDGLAALGAPAPELDSMASHASAAPSPAVLRPAGRPEDARGLDERESLGVARWISGVVVNLAVAAVLVALLVTSAAVYLNEGRLDPGIVNMERMKLLFAGRPTATLADVSNGLYETRSGRWVFFVRGAVHNRTGAPLNARVRGEILDGPELVRAAVGMAGEIPTPENLYELSSAADQARLAERLNQSARPVPPGAEAPFFLLFNFGEEMRPPDLANYRLRVTVTEGTATAGAAGARSDP